MEAVAHDPKFAAKAGVPQSVGREFTEADRQRERNKRLAKVLRDGK